VRLRVSCKRRFLLFHSPLWPGLICVSPLTNLQPVRRSYNNDALKLTVPDLYAYSPLLLIKKSAPPYPSIPIYISHAAHESTEFKRQAREYVKELKEHKVPVEFQISTDHDHFSIIERLVDPKDELTLKIQEYAGLL